MKISIDQEWAVTRTEAVAQAPRCPDLETIDPMFIETLERTLLTWRFEPAVLCVFEDAQANLASTNCEGARIVSQAVSLVYQFIFEQNEGRGGVRLEK
jgi:hypothetical protein